MNNKLSTFIALATLALAQTSFAKQDNNQVTINKEDIESVQVVCGPGATGCHQIISAKGSSVTKVMGSADDAENYDTIEAEKSITNLGRITAAKTISLPIPSEGKKLYAITPSEGLHANKAAKVLFYVFSLDKPFPAGTPAKVAQEARDAKAANDKRHTAIKVYKQPHGASQFTEIITEYTPETSFGNLKVNIDKEGKFVIPNFYGANIDGDLTTTKQ